LCYEDRLKAMDLPSLLYRRLRGDAIETYKLGLQILTINLTIKIFDND